MPLKQESLSAVGQQLLGRPSQPKPLELADPAVEARRFGAEGIGTRIQKAARRARF
jgi:hypothetical protein